MKKRNTNYLSSAISVEFLLAIIICAVTKEISQPEYGYVSTFSIACLLSLLCLFISLIFYKKAIKKNGIALAQYYMVHTLGKFFTSGLIAAGAVYYGKCDKRIFLFSFAAFFLLSLIYEVWTFVSYEKTIIKQTNHGED